MTNLSNGLVDQVSVIKEKLRKHIENGEQALIVEHNIYVPDSAVEAYKAATGWVSYASRIKPLSEYVES